METKILTLLLLLIITPAHTKGAITCSAFTTTDQTTVTCHFGVDVSETKHNINVEFYYPDMTVDPESTLMCNFLEDGEFRCVKAPDVTFDRVVSEEIRITRPASVDKLGGRYVCQLVPQQENTHIQPCNLTYTEIPPSSELTTKMPPHTEEADKEDSSDAAQAFLLVIGVIVLIFIIAVVIFCLVFYRRTKIIRSWWKSEEGPSGDDVIQNDTRIPSGLPTYFYNMGWRDAWTVENEKTVENRTTQTSNQDLVGQQEDTPQKQLRGSPENQTNAQRLKHVQVIKTGDIASPRSATWGQKEEFHDASSESVPMQNLGPSCPLLKGEQSQQGTSGKQHARPETKEEKKKRLEAEKRKAKEKEKAQWEAEKQRKREEKEKAKRKAKEERKERLEKEAQAAKK